MRVQPLQVYNWVSRLPVCRQSYQAKIMLVAFLGTHIPLLLLCLYFLQAQQANANRWHVLAVVLMATLLGTAFTLGVLRQLLLPILLTSTGLRNYLAFRELPRLPVHYQDEVGVLMADSQYALQKLDTVINHLASHDILTGLPNRSVFVGLISQVVKEAQQSAASVGIMVLHLDNFATLNHGLGEQAGDFLLRALAIRLEKTLSTRVLCARLANDEFGILYPNVARASQLTSDATALLEAIQEPIHYQNHLMHVLASIGITVYPEDEGDAEQLLGNANVAMRLARERGGSSFQFYTADMKEHLQRRLLLESALRAAQNQNQLQLVYQPQIDTATGCVCGVEALLRWHHPELGMISPAEFIPLAEHTGLIVSLGEWALRTACQQNKAWQDAGLPPIRVAVNLSARQFRQADLVERVAASLAESGLAAQWLELEVTESLMLEDHVLIKEILDRFRQLGLGLALDDFGTGYASLGYLQQLPFTGLKIDQSFIRRLAEPSTNAIISAMITLAQALQLQVTAEGVETVAELETLQERGCHKIQGYLLGKPMRAEQIAELLKTQYQVLPLAV